MKHDSHRLKWAVAASAGLMGLVLLSPTARHTIRRSYDFLRSDPYAGFRPNRGSVSTPTINMPSVLFSMYDKGTKIGEGLIKTVEITKDRQVMFLKGISNGKYFTKDGDLFNFSADRGQYNRTLQQMQWDGNVQIENKDMKLKTSVMKYEELTGILSVDDPIEGTLRGGQVKLASMRYAVKTGDFEGKKASWVGVPDVEIQETQGKGTKKQWTFDTGGIKFEKGNKTTYSDCRATNGDMIIIAPILERQKDKDVYTFSGGVKMFGKESNVAAPKAVLYTKEKRIELTGGVSLLIKPDNETVPKEEPIEPLRPIVPESLAADRPKAQQGEPQNPDTDVRASANRRKYPVKVFSDQITYYYKKGNRHAIITGSPQARQDFPDGGWRQIWTAKGYYDGEKETLKLESDGGKETRMKNSKGDDLTTLWVLLSTKQGDDSMETGKGKGTFKIDDDEDEEPGTTPPPPFPGNSQPGQLPGVIKKK